MSSTIESQSKTQLTPDQSNQPIQDPQHIPEKRQLRENLPYPTMDDYHADPLKALLIAMVWNNK